MPHQTNVQLVHGAIRQHELTRSEIATALRLTDRQVDSALSILLRYGAIKHNGVAGHRTYIAITAAAPADGRGKSTGSRKGAPNLEKSGCRRSAPVIFPDDWPRQVRGGDHPKPRLRLTLEQLWHPCFPSRAQK